MIESLLPSTVAVVEAYEDLPCRLYPEEEACVARAVASRRSEFATGRRCARVCLARLGLRPAAIAKDACGAPRWPDGVVGSITHCTGYRAAAVAQSGHVTSVGIDAEPHEPLPTAVLDLVSTPRERAHLAELARTAPGVAWDRLLFSAKESVYKAWFPLARTFLDFTAADVTFDPIRSTFVASLRVPGPLYDVPGTSTVRDGLLATAVTVAAA